MHSVLLGRCRLEVDGRQLDSLRGIAVPAGTRHHVREMAGPFGCVAYLDARRYRFEDAVRLADRWRGFVPGRDDLREAFGDALRAPRRRVDPRLLRALDVLEGEGASVEQAAARAGLSMSRMTHLMSDSLGPSPLDFRTWFKLRRALHGTLLGGYNLTQAAHEAGFADSAHLTRTCKRLMGVRPAQMLPRSIHVSREE
jgi:AraC-like DNA-binding protein